MTGFVGRRTSLSSSFLLESLAVESEWRGDEVAALVGVLVDREEAVPALLGILTFEGRLGDKIEESTTWCLWVLPFWSMSVFSTWCLRCSGHVPAVRGLLTSGAVRGVFTISLFVDKNDILSVVGKQLNPTVLKHFSSHFCHFA